MSAYTEALTELVALPVELDRQLARSKQEVAAARERHERELAAFVAEHEAVLARLEATLERARAEGVATDAGASPDGGRDASSSGDPLELAQQMVARLDEALSRVLYTRKALAAEEASLSEEERRRADEARRRREREEIRRGELWERARQGTIGLALGLAVAAVAGMVAGAVGPAAMVAVPLIAAAACLLQVTMSVSTLPALAVQRASGSMPQSPVVPPREARLAGAGHAAAALGLAGLGATVVGLLAGGSNGGVIAAAALTAVGAIVLAGVWLILPRAN